MHTIYLRRLAAMAPVVRKEYLLMKACTQVYIHLQSSLCLSDTYLRLQLSSAPDKRVQLRETGGMVTILKELMHGLQRALEKLEPMFTPERVVRPCAIRCGPH